MSLLMTAVSVGGSVLGGSSGSDSSNNGSGVIGSVVGNIPFLGNVLGGLSGVLANGFNFSCWGSSWSPARASSEGSQMVEYAINRSGFVQNQNLENFNKMIRILTIAEKSVIWGRDCTRQGTEAVAALFSEAKIRVINQFQNIYEVYDSEVLNNPHLGFEFTNQHTDQMSRYSGSVRVDLYKERSLQSGGSSGVNPNFQDATIQGSALMATQNSGLLDLLIYGGLGLGGFFLLKDQGIIK